MAELTSVEVAGIALVVGFPVLLMLAVVLLGRLERWILHPDERGAAVQRLLDEVEEAEAVERSAAQLLASATEPRAARRRAAAPARRAPLTSGRPGEAEH